MLKEPITKHQLLSRIRTGHRQLERYLFRFERGESGEFVAGTTLKLTREELTRRGAVGEGSVLDLLKRLTRCEQAFVQWYQANKNGRSVSSTSLGLHPDRASQAIGRSPRSVEEVVARFRASFSEILKLLERIPPQQMIRHYPRTEERLLGDLIADCTLKQYRWAKQRIRERVRVARRPTKAGLVQRITEERDHLERLVRGISKRDMIRRSAGGVWSVKDVLAHLVDWERRFLRWYRAGLRGEVPHTPAPRMTWRDLRLLNHQIFLKHRDRRLDDVLRDFDRSYRLTLSAVKAIPEDVMFAEGAYRWTGKASIAGYILANTANHYRWARRRIRSIVSSRGKRYGSR